MNTHTTQTYSSRKRIFQSLVLGILVSFFLYGMGITSATLAVAEVRGYRGDMNDIQTDITNLEFEYFQIVQNLSDEQIKEFGFAEQASVHYAYVDQTTTVAYHY